MTPWCICLALLSPLTFAIGWCCGRRSDETREADAEQREANAALLKARAEHIDQLKGWIGELQAQVQLLENDKAVMWRAVERLRGMG